MRSVPFSFTQSHSDSSNLTQIEVSLRFAQSHSDSCSLTQTCSASCNFIRIRSDSQSFTQSHSVHSVLLRFIQIPSDALRIYSDSHSLTPGSLCLPQTPSDSLRFVQSCAASPKLNPPTFSKRRACSIVVGTCPPSLQICLITVNILAQQARNPPGCGSAVLES